MLTATIFLVTASLGITAAVMIWVPVSYQLVGSRLLLNLKDGLNSPSSSSSATPSSLEKNSVIKFNGRILGETQPTSPGEDGDYNLDEVSENGKTATRYDQSTEIIADHVSF
ncbi:hypothetical protein K439DRAFT_1633452 [Ramaria rubella]|nr:hypothetical protein K439DRAFT_1633452 [Ramaria rubella]